MELGEHFGVFFYSQLLKMGAGLAKIKFSTDMLGLLSPKTTLNLF
jgi:hypothetical protein